MSYTSLAHRLPASLRPSAVEVDEMVRHLVDLGAAAPSRELYQEVELHLWLRRVCDLPEHGARRLAAAPRSTRALAA